MAIKKHECEKIAKKINEFIQCQASNWGKEANLPQVDKFHKEILFKDWESQLRQENKAAVKTSKLTKEIIESIYEQIWKSELIKEFRSEVLSEIKSLEE